MRQALARFNDQRLAVRAGETAALAGRPCDPENFLTSRLGAEPAPPPPELEIEQLVCVQQEDTIRAKITAVDETLGTYSNRWVYLLGAGTCVVIDIASNTSIMHDLGFDLFLSILQGGTITVSLIALVAGVRQ